MISLLIGINSGADHGLDHIHCRAVEVILSTTVHSVQYYYVHAGNH